MQQSSLESNSGGFGKTKAGGQSGFLRNTVELKSSPLIRRVSFPSDHELVDTHEPDVGLSEDVGKSVASTFEGHDHKSPSHSSKS